VPTGEATETTCGTGTILYEGACVVDSSLQISCGLGTVEDRGKCVPEDDSIPNGGVCGTGTELQEGVCVPNLDVCGTGTIDDNGVCVLAPESCAEGTTYDVIDMRCVDDSDIQCGPGTTLNTETQNCVPDGSGGATCGTGTELVDGTCVPDIDGCGQGTIEEEGECVAASTACGSGTSFDEGTGTCVGTGTVTCGTGTVFDDESSTCIADANQGATCANGTQLVDGFCVPDIDSCGAGTIEEDGSCVVTPAACGSGTTFDQGLGQCVGNAGITCGSGTVEEEGQCVLDASACGAGTTYDSETGTCIGQGNEAACGIGTSYDPVSQTCLPGTILLGDCQDAPTELTRLNTEDVTLAAGCYTAPNGLDIRARFNISPGVTIFMGDGEDLEIRSGGRLNAACLETNPCEIVGTTDAPGTWVGIESLTDVEANNVLEWVTIRNAGQNGASISINFNTLFDRMENLTIRDGRGYALTGAVPRIFNNVTVRTHESGSIRTRLDYIERIGTELDIEPEAGASDPFIEVQTVNLGGDTVVFRQLPVPYMWDSDNLVDLRGPIIVEAGVEIAFVEDSGWSFPGFDNRSLTVQGTSSEPVVMRGLEAQRGYWRGIYFDSGDTQNAFEWVEISDAGVDSESACLRIDGNALLPVFNNVTIRSCQGYAMSVEADPGVFGEFDNIWLTDNFAPLKVEWAGALPAMITETTDISGNDRNEIDLFGICNRFGECPVEDYTSIVFPVPLNVIGDGDGSFSDVFAIGNRAYLPGGTFTFGDLTILNSLGANFGLGSDSDSLVLQGEFATPGAWNGLRIDNATGFGNYIRNVSVSDAGAWEVTEAGFEGFYSVIIEDDVRIADIDGLTVANGFGRAVYVGENVVIDNCENVNLSDFTDAYAFGPGAAAFNSACGLSVP
jgi:hypothetical protein